MVSRGVFSEHPHVPVTDVPKEDASRELASVLDLPTLQSMIDDFYALTQIPSAVIDLDGNVLAGAGWQDVCVGFHRVNPETCAFCIESDTVLTADIPAGESRLYRCKNGMWDAAMPIVVGGTRMGNVFMGQFFFDDEVLDVEFFRQQAARYGFDDKAYLAAVNSVSRLSRSTVETGLDFLTKLTGVISQLGFNNAQIERQVQRRTVELREAVAELEAFNYSVSHDLRAPLRAIDGFSQALLVNYSDKLDEEGRDYLDRVKAAANRMGKLIDSLLALSRLSRCEMEIVNVDISRIAQETIDSLRACEPDRNVRSEVQPRIEVHGDVALLRSIVENLIGNAWKFTSRADDAAIEVGTMSVGSEKRVIFVKDNGAGFEMEYADKLFGAFQRLHKQEDFAGIGIGLATVARAVHRHGGRVWGESVPGQGATFYFTLP